MRILTVVFSLGKGGTERAAQHFSEAYKSLGHEIKVYALYEGGIRAEELQKQNIHVWVRTGKDTLDQIRKWKPEVLHLHSHGLDECDVRTLVDGLESKPQILETNVFSKKSPYDDLVDKSMQLSKWCAWLFQLRGGDPERMCVVPNPLNVNNFYPESTERIASFKKKYQIPENVKVFGRIGQQYYGKWSILLIDIFVEYVEEHDDNCVLVLVNPAELMIDYILKLPETIKIKIIIIDKLVGDFELRKFYSAVDVFLHIAEQGESFGMVLAESMLCQTPIITLSTPWNDNSQCEVVQNGRGGYVVTSKKYFLSAMLKLTASKNLIQSMGVNGRKHIVTSYNMQYVAEQALECIYRTDNVRFSVHEIKKMYRDVFGTFSKFHLLCLPFVKNKFVRFAMKYHTISVKSLICLVTHKIRR